MKFLIKFLIILFVFLFYNTVAQEDNKVEEYFNLVKKFSSSMLLKIKIVNNSEKIFKKQSFVIPDYQSVSKNISDDDLKVIVMKMNNAILNNPVEFKKHLVLMIWILKRKRK